MFDYPLEKLKEYRGSSPCPADFNEYWQFALNRLEETGLEYRLVPSDFHAENLLCYDLFFTGVGQAEIHCKFIRPEKPEGRIPAVLQFHGYTTNCGSWADKLKYAYSGCAMLSMDVRGQAGISQDSISVNGETVFGHLLKGVDDDDSSKLFYRNVYLDAVKAVWILMQMDFVDKGRVGVFGGSQGGGIALAAAALEPKIKAVVAMWPYLADFKRTLELGIPGAAYTQFSDYFRKKDPTRSNAEHMFNRLGYIDVQNFAERIKAQVYWLIGMQDTTCPPSTQFAVYNKINSKKKMDIYYDFAHETVPYSEEKTFAFLMHSLKCTD